MMVTEYSRRIGILDPAGNEYEHRHIGYRHISKPAPFRFFAAVSVQKTL